MKCASLLNLTSYPEGCGRPQGSLFYNIVFWANFTAADEHFLSRYVVVRVALVQKFAPKCLHDIFRFQQFFFHSYQGILKKWLLFTCSV